MLHEQILACTFHPTTLVSYPDPPPALREEPENGAYYHTKLNSCVHVGGCLNAHSDHFYLVTIIFIVHEVLNHVAQGKFAQKIEE